MQEFKFSFIAAIKSSLLNNFRIVSCSYRIVSISYQDHKFSIHLRSGLSIWQVFAISSSKKICTFYAENKGLLW